MSRSSGGMGTSAMTAACVIMSAVIFGASAFSCCAMPQRTPGKRVPARPNLEQTERKLRRFSIDLTSAADCAKGMDRSQAERVTEEAGEDILVANDLQRVRGRGEK